MGEVEVEEMGETEDVDGAVDVVILATELDDDEPYTEYPCC